MSETTVSALEYMLACNTNQSHRYIIILFVLKCKEWLHFYTEEFLSIFK